MALLLEVHLNSHLPPGAFLQHVGQQLQVEPQAGLDDEQVLIAFIGDEKVQADPGGGEAICGEAGEQAKLIQENTRQWGKSLRAAQRLECTFKPRSWKRL